MPAKPDERQYRSMAMPLTAVGEGVSKRFDTDYYVEGYASTFNDPYLLFERDGWEYWEVVSPSAFDGATVMDDVIMQYDHAGQVYARQSNHTLIIEPDEHGLFVAADIAPDGEEWVEDATNRRVTSTITRVSKCFDVSAVSYPADPNTEISARSLVDGVIEREKRESQVRFAELARKRSLLALKAKAAQVRFMQLR